ncbi:MAG: hypothetical protein JWP76_1258 [Dactylosporangium sp.]|jgi:hypothetical protein|nr:hypothetical protein [Dactylosporangium sp.]
MSSEQPSIVEGGGGESRLDWLNAGSPVVRGAGLGWALAGFGLLIAAQLLPWISLTTNPLQQDFPTSTGGRLERGLAELVVPTDIFNLGWLIVLAAVATALAVPASARRAVVAAGLGLVAGQLALLVGMTRGVQHNGVLRGTIPQTEAPVTLQAGLYCAYAALVLFALALLFAGGVPRWLRGRPGRRPASNDVASDGAELAGPPDLTVTAIPTADPAVWSQAQSDIEVGGRRPER